MVADFAQPFTGMAFGAEEKASGTGIAVTPSRRLSKPVVHEAASSPDIHEQALVILGHNAPNMDKFSNARLT